jgi:CO/xanthine dehydrogenase FAD-binding subunit
VIARAASLEVLRPRRLRDAIAMLRDEGPLVPLAGGTDLFVALNAGMLPGRRYLDLWRLDELRGVAADGKGLRLGALATFTDCIASSIVRRRLPILAAAAREVGGVQIQNRGTLGGNIGNGSPAGDSLPVFAAAEATLVLVGPGGEREVPFAAFYTGYRATVRRPDELIAAIRVPPLPRGPQRFRKVGTRAAQAISKVVMASVGHRVAFGSVAPTVVRARTLEAYLEGGGRDPVEARRRVLDDIRPIDDVRSTAEYRRRVTANLAAALVEG